ncbi:MAG: MerR family transcriptional regulator [Oscillospiraceae bacterium]|nr:MerR family transcriptional regulator [Oscillospiraceae bacterium]
MMTIKDVSKRTGVSARALRYYDAIGLLRPAGKTEAGYRLYDEKALAALQEILYFRELDVPLSTIGELMENPALDREQILRAQRALLMAKKDRLERLIDSIDAALKGEETMDFTVFSREETAELFAAMLAHMPAALQETAIGEFGSVEKWREHYLDALSAEKIQRQYAKVVEWYGGKEAYADAVRHPLSETIRMSYKRRIDAVLDKLAEKRTLGAQSHAVRELIGEYGFVMKKLLQLKDEKAIMLSQARTYLDDAVRRVTDERYGEGFAAFLHEAITAFYER